jgi:hypothetical protein
MVASISRFVLPPAILLAALGIYRVLAVSPVKEELNPPRATPWVVQPRHNEPRVATDEQLREVLIRVRPPIDPINANHFIHALRLWGPEATFDDPRLPSGAEMRDFFLQDEVFRKWAGNDKPPLFIRADDGVRTRDFDENFDQRFTSSYHNDDFLATFAESGLSLDTPMQLRDGPATVREFLTATMKRFHADRYEFEWSVISYLRYLYPLTEFENKFGEKLTASQLVQMCLNGKPGSGPCRGQHRYEALVVLLAIDEQSPGLSPQGRQAVIEHLKKASANLVASQSPAGFWTAKWIDGAAGQGDDKASMDEKILVTGHALEWLALAPEEALPPRENIVRAGQWIVQAINEVDEKTLVERYGPNSHAVRALCLWRGKEAYPMWQSLPKESPAEKPAE